MNAAAATSPAPASDAWARHLACAAHRAAHDTQGPAPARRAGLGAPLSAQEAHRVQRYQDRLIAAVLARDRSALRDAKQAVLEAAFGGPGDTARGAGGASGSPAMRRALRELCWRMAGLVLPRQRGG